MPLHVPLGLDLHDNACTALLKAGTKLPPEFGSGVVLIGARLKKDISEGGEEVRLSLDGKRTTWGYAVHAVALSDLSQGTFPRPLRWWWMILLLAVSGLLAGLARGRFKRLGEFEFDTKILGKYKIPTSLALVVGAECLLAFLLYTHMFIVLDIQYAALATIAAYYTCGTASKPG